ncbi:aminotransferase class V-fold PLP-dependent enzyme [Alkalihalobacillus oceani]|uniref:aminotransferase class V-fold PLP-dependent enzyme n=1 Tax=Halalkalibacter oceani TaxID=1653776 RepID=UPI00203B77F8|nr:aminotransferase class V-fold PLP-dependent enzyme [Halalkalibacter oceani]MCM3762797.1 aminotransferase class V-fold PLP-dependent enzyme [Halalkalibacter oceani]
MIYFDHAASSFPKPKAVADAMYEAVTQYAANPGRGGHVLAERARLTVEEARAKLAALFGAPQPKHVWFYQNATMALNQALFGFQFEEGDHVVTTAFEHNSVLRPLERLKREKGINVTYVKPNEEDEITAQALMEACTAKTKMLALSHASNVTGAFIQIDQLASFAKENEITVLLDASQTAGTLPIHMEKDGIDLLAFAGHKSLLGPQGTGVLISREDYGLLPLVVGGTGSYSELPVQPDVWPDRYEAGTLNTPGIAGLAAGVDEIVKKGIATIYEHEQELLTLFIEETEQIAGLRHYGPADLAKRVAVASFYLEGIGSHELAIILDEHYQIAVRAGLHCAPQTHRVLETSNSGLVRVSFGPYNTKEEVKTLVRALKEIQQAFV